MSTQTIKPLYRSAQIVWYILGIIQVLLAARFILKLLQANPQAGFTDLVYTLSGIFTIPFETVFQNIYVSGSVFEWTTLLAMLVYWVIAWGIIKLFIMGKPVSTAEANAKLNDENL